MKVYLIRHAESVENALDFRQRVAASTFNRLLERSHEAPLTARGEAQARALVQRLAGARIGHLYSSPFARALSTATILGAAFDLTPQIVPDLREVLPRPLSELHPKASLRRHFVRSYLGMLWPWGDDETWAAGYRRAQAAWAHITSEPGAEVAAVAHSGINSLILLALRRDRRWRVLRRDIANGGVSVIVSR